MFESRSASADNPFLRKPVSGNPFVDGLEMSQNSQRKLTTFFGNFVSNSATENTPDRGSTQFFRKGLGFLSPNRNNQDQCKSVDNDILSKLSDDDYRKSNLT